MPLNDLGPSTQHIVLWTMGMYLPSIFALVLTCCKERDGFSRILTLILLLVFPIIAPLAMFLYYCLSQLRGRKHLRKLT